jgi:hypothetical protein
VIAGWQYPPSFPASLLKPPKTNFAAAWSHDQNRRMQMFQLRNGAYAVIAAAVLSSLPVSVALVKCGNQAAAVSHRTATQSTRAMPAPAKAIAVPQTFPAFPEGSFD